MKLIIHAPNIHQGGGRALLVALLDALPEGHEYTLQADARLTLSPAPAGVSIIRVPPTLAARYAAERRLPRLAGLGDAVLCMGNLPPLFKVAARTYLLLQNRYLCEDIGLTGFAATARLRIRAERLWLRARIGSVTRVIVQTHSMHDCVRAAFGVNAAVLPFFARDISAMHVNAAIGDASDRRFLYVASAGPHKNHDRLFDAWRCLAAEGLRPELHLTLPTDCPLGRAAERLGETGVCILNHGEVDEGKLKDLYRSCHALVFPSKIESFGLPLLEARAAGLAVIASERDYVRDTIDPEQTFDPDSPRSIARAIKRYLGITELRPALLSPGDFARRILSGDV